MEPQYYWELIQKDGTVIEIPPEAVETVKRRWDAGQPIHTRHQGSIPPNQIAAFRPTNKPANAQTMLEDVAQAFKEPIIHEVESPLGYKEEVMAARWVKKLVTQAKWDKYYSAIPSYHRIGDEAGMVMIAFSVPVHLIEPATTQLCTTDEVSQLERA